MEAMTHAEALEATHDHSQLMRENQKHERELADPDPLKTAEGFKVAEWHGRGRAAMMRQPESMLPIAPWTLANALQDTVHQDIANGNAKRGAALPKRESVAKTLQNGAKA